MFEHEVALVHTGKELLKAGVGGVPSNPHQVGRVNDWFAVREDPSGKLALVDPVAALVNG